MAGKVNYVRATAKTQNRIVASIDGLPGDGKTRFAFTAPGPIAIHTFDPLGVQRALGEFKNKEIYQFDYLLPYSVALPGAPTPGMADAARPVWTEFVNNFRQSLQDMKTVIVDHGGEPWNVLRLARLGKLTQVMPIQYTSVNAEFRQLVQLVVPSNANVFFLHKLKKEYKDDKWTGDFDRSGFGDIEFDVDVIMRCKRDDTKEGVDRFSMIVEKGGSNMAAVGKELKGNECDYAHMAKLIYPDVPEEEWLK